MLAGIVLEETLPIISKLGSKAYPALIQICNQKQQSTAKQTTSNTIF